MVVSVVYTLIHWHWYEDHHRMTGAGWTPGMRVFQCSEILVAPSFWNEWLRGNYTRSFKIRHKVNLSLVPLTGSHSGDMHLLLKWGLNIKWLGPPGRQVLLNSVLARAAQSQGYISANMFVKPGLAQQAGRDRCMAGALGTCWCPPILVIVTATKWVMKHINQ